MAQLKELVPPGLQNDFFWSKILSFSVLRRPPLLPWEGALPRRRPGGLCPIEDPRCLLLLCNWAASLPALIAACQLPPRSGPAGLRPRCCAPLPGCHLARARYFCFNSLPFLEDFPDWEIQSEAAPSGLAASTDLCQPRAHHAQDGELLLLCCREGAEGPHVPAAQRPLRTTGAPVFQERGCSFISRSIKASRHEGNVSGKREDMFLSLH